MKNNNIKKFLYGSRLYGSHLENSDFDYLGIVPNDYDFSSSTNPIISINDSGKNESIYLYTEAEYQRALNNHDITALEIYFKYKLQNKYKFNLNKMQLRQFISTIVNNSWVKSKKKLIVSGDYDKFVGIKSTFHSLRICEFGIQIATTGRISKYDSMNWLMTELYELADKYDRIELWEVIDTRYRKLYNQLRTEFKKTCPKFKNEKEDKIELTKILEPYNVPEQTINKILFLLE